MIERIKLYTENHKADLKTDAFAFGAALVVFALPFSIKLTTQAIVILTLIWLWQRPLKRLRLAAKKPFIWLISGPYLLTIVSLLYTQDLKAGIWELEKGLALLLFPILMATANPLPQSRVDFILKSFLSANLLFGIISVGYAVFKYVRDGVNFFFYHDLVSPLFNSHATYYSMYLIFSLFILYYFYFRTAHRSWRFSLLTAGVTIFFSVLIYLLAIRSVIFFFTCGTLAAISFYVYKTRNIIMGAGMLLGFVFLILFAFRKNDVLKEKFFQILENYEYEMSEDNIEGYNGLTTRLAQWESSLSIIREHPVLGVGPADVQAHLQQVYLENYLLYSYKSRFNAHSQYVQTTLGLGVTGLIVLLASFLIPGVLAIRQRNMLYLGFLILFSFCCITESMLYVQKGLVFYSVFTSLFLFHTIKGSRTKDDMRP